MQTNPVKVIREKCLDCCCDSAPEVASCEIERCPLHPFRFGKNPYRKKSDMTEEKLERLREMAKKARGSIGE